MPALTYSVADFVAFTKIKSAEVNAKYSDIQTLLNTTKLDDFNLQDGGITRGTKLATGTSQNIVVNDATGAMSEIGVANGGLLSKVSDALSAIPAGLQGQLLQSNAANLPTWVDSPFSLPSHYIVSGAESSDGQPDFIRPDGAGTDDFTIRCSTTNMVVVIENTQTTLTQDINVTGLDPLSTITANIEATVNDPELADELWTKLVGELDTPLRLDSVGSEIVSKAGQLAAFRLDTGAGTEYFTGRVDYGATSSDTRISDCKRGYFVDDTGAPQNRIVLADNDTITIMNLFWVFVDNANLGYTTTLEPIYADVEPTGISTDQYWFDLGSNEWKRYNGTTFDTVPRILIGQVIVDENDAVVGARSYNFFSATDSLNTVRLEDFSDTQVRTKSEGEISVLGNLFRFKGAALTFDMANASQLVPTEAASTWYYLYITKDGALKIDDVAPYNCLELKGRYHPHKPWRSVGTAYNNASQNIVNIWGTGPNTYMPDFEFIIGSTGTPPTKGAITVDVARPVITNGTLVVHATFAQGTGGAVGTGTYLFNVPQGVFIDRTLYQNSSYYGNCAAPAGSLFGFMSNVPADNTVDYANMRINVGNNTTLLASVGASLANMSAAQIYTYILDIKTRQFSSKDLL